MKTYGELTRFLDERIEKAGGSHREDLLKVQKLAQDMAEYVCDMVSDLTDDDVLSAFWRACVDSPRNAH